MKAALYARKSTDDSDKNVDNKSVTRQVEHARAFAQAKGWSVEDEHVFIDDGISGAEYQNRPGFNRLITHLKEFDVLVMSEPSRLGRDMLRNAYHVGDIIENGVKIYYYLNDEQELADTPEQKVMLTLKSYAGEVERQKASQRSRDALERKAAKGYNAGGIVYGYDNIPVMVTNGQGEEVRSHTDYKINGQQAKVIHGICRMYADGHGFTTIAKTLNGANKTKNEKYFGYIPPSPRKGTGSWAPSSVRAILLNQRYTGKVPYGKYRKAYRGGTKIRVKTDRQTWADRPDLQIVSPALRGEVRNRHEAATKDYIRNTDGTLWGRPGMGRESKYLLTGLGRCSCCGSNIAMIGGRSGSPGKRRPLYYYGCSYHQNRGETVCANDHKAHMEELDGRVLTAIEQQVLTPEAVTYVVERAVQVVVHRLEQDPERPKQITAELRRLRKELANFMGLVAQGKAPATLLKEVRKREERIAELEQEQRRFEMRTPTDLDLHRLKKALRDRVGRFKDLIYADVPVARQALRKLLAEPMQFSPVTHRGRKTMTFEGRIKAGILVDPGYIGVASPRGVEPLLPA